MRDVEHPSADMRTSALLRIVSAIETATTLDELLLLTLNEFTQLFDVSQAAVVMILEEGDTTRLLGTYPPRISLPPPVPLKETPFLLQAIDLRQPLFLNNMLHMPSSSPYIEILQESGVHSLLLMPLVAQDHVMGVLALGATGNMPPALENEPGLIRILAGQLAAAINAFCLTESARRWSEELATLSDISSAVTSTLDTQEVYHLVVQKLNEYFRVEAGSLLMRDDQTGELQFVMTLEAGEEKLAGVKVPRGQGVVGHVAETQRYAIVLNPKEDPRFYSKISERTGYLTRSILCVPMIVKGRTIGVIELLNKRDGEFTEEDAERLMRMASTIGVAIENARLFQQVSTGRDRLEAILNSNNDGILMAEMQNVVVTVNPKAAQIFQTTQEDLLGRRLPDLLDELRTRALDVSVPSWLNDRASGTSEVVEIELGGPQYTFIRQLSLPVRDTTGAIIGQLTLLQDISKERELSQLRDDYTGMLVHDLRAPLTAIMNGIMMVRRGMGGSVTEQQDELLGIAYNSSQTMLEMVSTLLDISKMEEGRMSLHPELFSPYSVVDETMTRLRPSAEGHQIILQQQLPSGLPEIEADREKVVRVLQNLVDNAIKYSPSGGEVTIGVVCTHIGRNGRIDPVLSRRFNPVHLTVTLPEHEEGDWVVFWVRDQGPGIPPQYHERIFEKFGQVRGRKVRGTGLGLTFSKLAVESHGGHIWIESSGEGDGSTFALTLPLKSKYALIG